jgi:hypothetical protein
MTRKLNYRTHVFRGIALASFIPSVFVVLAALAPVTSAGQSSVKPAVVYTRQYATLPAEAWKHRLLPGDMGVGRLPVNDPQGRRSAAGAMDNEIPFFLPAVTYSSGGLYAKSIAIADVNRDGKLDLLVTSSDSPYDTCFAAGSVGVLLGNGDGTFQTATTYNTGGHYASSIAVADIDGDDRLDLVASNWCDVNYGHGSVGKLLGNGDGTFQAAVSYDTGGYYASSVAVADVNGDGKPDLLVDNWGGENNANQSGDGTVAVLLGNGDGTFRAAVSYDTGGYYAWSVAVADVNLDRKFDLVIANSCVSGCEFPGASVVGVLLGNGDGTFQAAATYGSGGYYGGSVVVSAAVEDVNGDGKPDLVVANQCATAENCTNGSVGVLPGNGDGTFSPAVTHDSGGYGADSVAVADVNRDGKADLVTANYCTSGGPGNCSSAEGLAGVLLGNGDGTFQAAMTYDSGALTSRSVLARDLNGDGRPDLAVATFYSVGVLLNNFGPHTPTTTALASNVNPAIPNQLVTYTATVTSQSNEITGTVTFYDGGATIATVPPVNNQAAYSTKYKRIGAHTIAATYSGDLHNEGSTSATVTEYIKFPSKTVSTTSGSPSLVGQPVTFTARVTSGNGAIPDGEQVTFYDGTTAIGTNATARGVATYTTSLLTARAHTIKATYAGDANFKPSSGLVMQLVQKYPTTTALSSSPNPSAHGRAVIFTATVASAGPPPTGKVRFMDGTTVLGSVTLSGGAAKLTKSTLAVGAHPITAQYLGDAASGKSTSSVLDQVVQ